MHMNENTTYLDIIELILSMTKSYEIDGIFDLSLIHI